MGIPHLTTYLRPYAEAIQWTSNSGDAEEVKARLVIDGPAFAYHVYYLCLNRNARHALEAVPSYRLLQETALSWLSVCENCGLEVKSIYFDGYLPREKISTRRSRLEKCVVDIQKFRHAQSDPISYRQDPAWQAGLNKKFERTSLPAKLKAIPAAPFLVPAIIEALLSSEQYAQKLSVVPYEADDYCVQDCIASDACILTSDSDLLVKSREDGGRPARVLFFQDVEMIQEPSGVLLQALCFGPDKIAKTLGVDLTAIGWALYTHPSFSLRQCVQKVQSIEVPSNDYENLQCFKIDACAKKWVSDSFPALLDSYRQTTRSEHPVGGILRILDPRISELVLQAKPRRLRHIISSDFGPEPESAPIESFLPFLIDDSSRASAWRASSSIRALAIAMLRQVDMSLPPVFELDRHGSRIVGSLVATMSPDELIQICGALRATIQRQPTWPPKTSSDNIWRAESLLLTLEMLREQETSMPPLPVIRHLLGQQHKKATQCTSWAALHLHAQAQATLYSLRMLQQISAVYLALTEQEEVDESDEGHEGVMKQSCEITAAVMELKRQLDGLPPLHSLFGHICGPLIGPTTDASFVLEDIIRQFYEVNLDKRGADLHETEQRTSTLKVAWNNSPSGKGKKRKAQSQKQSHEVKNDPGNRFSALRTD